MLDFSFTEEQEMFRKAVRNFAQREIAPGYSERAKKSDPPINEIKAMAAQGLLGITIPEKYGGQGADHVTLGIAIEEMARADYSCANIVACNGLAQGFFGHQCAEKLRQEWLPAIARGDKLVGIALTEPDCGSDAAAIKTTAIKDGNGHYIINGEKSSISFVPFAAAMYLFAKTDPKAGAKGVTGFLLPLDLPGITKSVFNDMGCRPQGRGTLAFEDVKLPEIYRIGEEGRGFYVIMGEFDYARAGIGLMCLGTAQVALEDAITYARERVAFGRPIARFEGVSFLIAEHATLMEAARLLCYKTLWMRDQGIRHTKEAAMCKWWVPKLCVNAIHDCLLIHGHFGYSDEFPQEQRLRDVIGYEIADGTAQIQKIVIAREIIGKEYLPY